MSFFKKTLPYKDSSDATLVMACLGGDRDAFGEVVSRYQSLLCSLAYSSVGDFKHSEDIAQEAFVEAWRKLDTLSDPEKLKAWLCGILRFKVSRHRRSAARHPLGEYDETTEPASEQASIDDTLIQQQEQTLLWQALEKLPDTYREPLILFYREQRSVEHVANELDLSEDAVKQRLSRGRKILQKAMMDFVENALEKSKPGAAFTLSVLTAISGIGAPKAQAAALGIGASHAGSVFKWASLVTLLASFSGVIGSFFSVRASLDQSRTAKEKRAAIVVVSLFFAVAGVFVAGMFLLEHLAKGAPEMAAAYALSSQLLVLAFGATYLWLLVWMLKRQPKLRAQERARLPEAFTHESDAPGSTRREIKSRWTLGGIALLHFKLGMPEAGDKPALAWIAGGDRAYGLLFAWGGLAVAPVSVGIVSVGFISIGALGFGLIALGTLAVGFIGFGASSIAYKAYGSLSALGWDTAFSGGFAVAREAAIGPLAFARLINNEQAAGLVNLGALEQHHLWVLGVMSVLVIVPAMWHAKMVRKRMGRQDTPVH